MPLTRSISLLTLLTILATTLAACGGAPATQSGDAATAVAPPATAPVATKQLAPTAAAAPTAQTAPTAAPAPTTVAAATTAPDATSVPLADTSPDKPSDTTQGRLRLSNCVMGGPSVDVLVNGKVAVNGGMPQANLGALDASGYLFLAPATYSVALVPTGKESTRRCSARSTCR